MARHNAAFINMLAESGNKDEVLKYLQSTWDDYCELRGKVREWEQYFRRAGYQIMANEMRQAAQEDGNGPTRD